MNRNEYESYFTMSLACLEIGKVSAIRENNTVEYQNTVAYQLYHVLELFVKYAILKRKRNVKSIHDLAKLFSEYYQLYQDDMYRIDHPFDFTSYEFCKLNIGEEEMYNKHIYQFKPKIMDQHLRYPLDSNTGGYSFKIECGYFVLIRDIFLELHCKIN